MRLHRFYIDTPLSLHAHLTLTQEELLHQWMRVFRLQQGDEVVLFDGSGCEFHARFEELHKSKAVLEIIEGPKKAFIPHREVYLFMALVKKDKFEWVIEKATELGVSHIVPILAERSEKKNVNHERFVKIATEAAEQSGRGTVPHIYEPLSIEETLQAFKDIEMVVTDFGGVSLNEIKNTVTPLGVFVGPEGGWGEKDKRLFEEYKVVAVSLGEQTLRAETAAVAVSTLLLL